MPLDSPGPRSSTNHETTQPGQPNESLQATTAFYFRHKRYVAYISGNQLIILGSPDAVLQVVHFSTPLRAVSSHSLEGKLVVAEDNDVLILNPVTEGWSKVWWEKTLFLSRADDSDDTQSISWTNEGEILVGGRKSLTLFSTHASGNASISGNGVHGEHVEERRPLWSVKLPSPVNSVVMSPSANLIATSSVYDKLVKIWRRLSFETGLFDYVYLPHPEPVTHLEWKPEKQDPLQRRSSGVSSRLEDEPEVLYTIASDGILRLWKSSSMHDTEVLVLYSTINLASAIPLSPSPSNKGRPHHSKQARYIFIISSDQFCAAASTAIASYSGQSSHSFEHLKEVVSNSPDIFVILDGNGRMSAWGLQSIGHKRRPDSPSSDEAFHIAHAEDLLLKFSNTSNARFHHWLENDQLHCLVHSFEGSIQWWQGSIEAFLSPSTPGHDRFQKRVTWSGHASPIETIVVSNDSRHAMTWTEKGDARLWTRSGKDGLECQPVFQISPCPRAASFSVTSQDFIVCEPDCIAIYSLENGLQRAQIAHNLDFSAAYSVREIDKGVLFLDHAGTLTLLSFSLDREDPKLLTVSKLALPDDYKFEKFSILYTDNDPAVIAFAGTDENGRIAHCAAFFDRNWKLHARDWSVYQSLVAKPSLFHASEGIAALTSLQTKSLAIIDLAEGYLEYQENLLDEVTSLTCFKRQDGRKGLAVAFQDRIEVFIQLRYAQHRSKTVWKRCNIVSVEDTGSGIGSVHYFGKDELLFGFVNGLRLRPINIHDTDRKDDIQRADEFDDAHEELPLPIWHPEYIERLVYHAGPAAALDVFQRLFENLKFWTEGDEFLKDLDISFDQLLSPPQSISDTFSAEDSQATLLQHLNEKRLPYVSEKGQDFLRLVFKAIVFISGHGGGLDSFALFYLFVWKLHILQNEHGDNTINSDHGNDETQEGRTHYVPIMQWREISFAYHSKTQQPLLDIIILHYDNSLTWDIARNLGVTAWLTDLKALRQVFESLAQSAYRATTPADPTNASLYFLALHKKTTLLGLWRIATWHREQKATMNFLKRDFNLPESKTAAKKNAYALMGKRRFEYAAAFFLLADDGSSAVSMLAGQRDDTMLAVAVARLYSDTEGSTVLRKLIDDRLIPLAKSENDRWLMSWCHSMLLEPSHAATALIQPLHGTRRWLQDDPAIMLLYRHIRMKPSPFEYAALLRAARILRRMGLLPLALHLVQSWQFLHDKPSPDRNLHNATPDSKANGHVGQEASSEQSHVPSMLDGFAQDSPVVSDKAAREAKAAELLKKLKEKKDQVGNGEVVKPRPPPTQFNEPDPNSLLDSFGF